MRNASKPLKTNSRGRNKMNTYERIFLQTKKIIAKFGAKEDLLLQALLKNENRIFNLKASNNVSDNLLEKLHFKSAYILDASERLRKEKIRLLNLMKEYDELESKIYSRYSSASEVIQAIGKRRRIKRKWKRVLNDYKNK